jgi:hypothetical protein
MIEEFRFGYQGRREFLSSLSDPEKSRGSTHSSVKYVPWVLSPEGKWKRREAKRRLKILNFHNLATE